MNSVGRVLADFNYRYVGPISIVRGKSYDGKGASRTMFLSPKTLEEIPEQLFAVKMSQSPNPAKAGKPTFRYFSYRFQENAKFENLAPTGVTLDMPLSDVKALVISKMANMPAETTQFSINVKLHGRYANLKCADGEFVLFNDDEPKLQSDNPDKCGETPYYVKRDAVITVDLKGAESQGNEYLQSNLSTELTSLDVFQTASAGKLWEGPGVTPGAAAPMPAPMAAPEAPVQNVAGATAGW